MSDYLAIWLTGVDGSHWDLAGPNAGDQFVELRPGPKRFFDAPAKTFWIQGAANMHYQGHQFERRDPVFAVNIIVDGDPAGWRQVDSQFRTALGMYDQQFTLTVETDYGARNLDLRLLSEPTAYESGPWEQGKDPHLMCASTLMINAAAGQPFWYADDLEFSWTAVTGTGSTTFPAQNLGDVDVWPKFLVTAPGTWTLPDYSWGQEGAYQRPDGVDAARTVVLPALLTGEDCDVDSDPDEEALVAANGAPVWARWDGNGLLYPIAPATVPTAVPVSVTGASAGSAVTMTIPQRFSRPWGVSL